MQMWMTCYREKEPRKGKRKGKMDSQSEWKEAMLLLSLFPDGVGVINTAL